MTRQILWLSVALFCFCLPAYSQDYTYDGTLTQNDIDQSTLYGAPSDPTDMEEGLTYMYQIIDNEVIPFTGGTGREWQATTGCLNASEGNGGDGSWAGTSGGSCANIGTNGDGAIRFGYNTTVVAQTQSAIADALKVAGITVVGYRYQWKVKNANANDTTAVQMNNQDPLIVTVTVKDPDGNELFSKEYNYSTYISSWQLKYGMEWYDPFISGDKIDTITLEVEGRDAGGWAGYWGPEFREAGIYSIMVVEPEVTNCEDPLLDPTCPGYAEALNAQQDEMLELIADVTSTDIVAQDDDVAFVEDQVAQGREYFEDDFYEETILEEEVVEEEQYEAVVEEVALEEVVEEQSSGPSIDALSVAQNAVAGALADAESAASSTLESTAQSVADATSISQNLQSEAMTAFEQMNEQAELETSVVTASNDIESAQQSMDQAEQQADNSSSQQSMSSMDQSTGDVNEMAVLNDSISINSDTQTDELTDQIANVEIVVDMTTETFEIAALDMAINAAFNNIVQRDTQPQEKKQEQTTEEQNEQEDELVAQALSGDESEEAQAALLGYNPNFREYQQPQMADADFYKPKDIYEGQKNYDNPNQRFFNGASDQLHREMVRSQYD